MPSASAATAPQTQQHPDDHAVDRFAVALKDKLSKDRQKGRGGWETCRAEDLSQMLRDHVEKGDPRDVANFCMFLWSLGQAIAPKDDMAGKYPVAAQCRFPGGDWSECSVEHARMVQSSPQQWPGGYEVRLLTVFEPPASQPGHNADAHKRGYATGLCQKDSTR